MTTRGSNLIFLVSQPRAGSTMLQKMLSRHADIFTLQEPWLLLHPGYSLRTDGIDTEYMVEWSVPYVRDFIRELPSKEEDYYEGLRRMYGYLYSQALQQSGARYFLDKTPRYYFIIPELVRLFPDAHLILLFRNPIAVLSSMYLTWGRVDITRLNWLQHDLLQAPHRLVVGIRQPTKHLLTVHYEKLVSDPEDEMRRISTWLDVPFDSQMVDYGKDANQDKWRLGDQTVYEMSRPQARNADQWKDSIKEPQLWRLANDYLSELDETTIADMGYSASEIHDVLEANRPSRTQLRMTTSLRDVLARKMTLPRLFRLPRELYKRIQQLVRD